MSAEPHRFYFVGIGGIGMASVAAYLRQLGKTVSGSDSEVYSPSLDLLRRLQIQFQTDFSVAHLLAFRPDICVIGAIVGRTKNPQIEAIREMGIHTCSFPEVIERFIVRGMRQIVVTGTHGKTTTSALIAEGLNACGIGCDFIIGGESIQSQSSFRCSPDASHILIEGDEYIISASEPYAKFLRYYPNLLVINNIEWDHIDAYPMFSLVLDQFQRLVEKIRSDSVIVANWDDPAIRQVCTGSKALIVTYGTERQNPTDYVVDLDSAVTSKEGTHFALRAVSVGAHALNVQVHTPLIGRFNLLNVTASIIALQKIGVPLPAILEFMKSFKRVRRRLEVLFETDQVSVFDDFGHHPTAVRSTLDALRAQVGNARKIIAVFEPSSSSSRRTEFFDSYSHSFSSADKVLIAPVKKDPRWNPEDHLDCQKLAVAIGHKATPCDSYEQILEQLSPFPDEPSHFIFFSSGKFGELPAKLAERFNQML